MPNLTTLAADFRRDADDCEAFLRGEVPCPPWLAPGDRVRVETRMYVLREVAERLEQCQAPEATFPLPGGWTVSVPTNAAVAWVARDGGGRR